MAPSSSDQILNRLVDFALGTKTRPLSTNAIENLMARVIDALACAAAATRAPDVVAVIDCVLALGGSPSCRVLGRGGASIDSAAYLNGFMVRYFDWNDTYVGKNGGHPSDLIAALLAAAEFSGKSGLEFLGALATATHVMLDLCDAADTLSRGWDHAIYTGIAASVGVGVLLDLDARRLAQAIALTTVSGNMLIGRTGNIATWKGLAAPTAIRNAVHSVLLARAGVTGPDPIFEGEYGFVKHVSGPLDPELDLGRDRTGDTHLKLFPAVYHAQGPIAIAIDVRERAMRELAITDLAAAIEDARLSVYPFAIKWAAADPAAWRPATRESADHSLPFLVALALITGDCAQDAIEPAIHDARVLRLASKIRVEADPEMGARWPKFAPARLEIHVGGRTFAGAIEAPAGHAVRPLSRADIERKFLHNAAASGFVQPEEWLAKIRALPLAARTDVWTPP